MKTYNFLLFDLDGTLLNAQRQIHPANVAKLKELMAAGIRVGFATGRSRLSVQPYVEQLAPTGPLILFNGARVWDLEQEAPIFACDLPRPEALTAIKLAESLGLHINLYLDDQLYIARSTSVSRASEAKDGLRHRVVGDLAAFLTAAQRDPIKLLLIGDPVHFPQIEAGLVRPGRHHCNLVHSEHDYLEVLPPNVTKGEALPYLAGASSPQQIIAFGDNLNDREMLRQSGLGVAMGNAHSLLQQEADIVIGDCDSDAIAIFLERHTRLQGNHLSYLAVPGSAQGG